MNEPGKAIPIEEDMPALRRQVVGAIAECYNNLILVSYKTKNISLAFEEFKRIDDLGACLFEEILYLRDAVFTHLCYAKQACNNAGRQDKEKIVQKHFFDNLSHYIPGATIAKSEKKTGHIPDGFVEIEGNVYPVEVKAERFTGASLEQLTRYMRAYKASKGVAVAKELRCTIPDNVIFISVNTKEA